MLFGGSGSGRGRPATIDTSTRLLLHFEDSLTDSSIFRTTLTAESGAAVSTEQSKFGTKSLKLIRSSSQKIYTPSIPELFDMGISAFKVECFVRLVGYGASCSTVFSWFSYDSFGFRVQICKDGTIWGVYATAAGGGGSMQSGAGAIALNTWYHVAFSRSGNTMILWVDGSQVATATTDMFNNTRFNIYNSSPDIMCTIGNINQGGYTEWLDGYVDEFRYFVGNGSVTVPTSPYAPY